MRKDQPLFRTHLLINIPADYKCVIENNSYLQLAQSGVIRTNESSLSYLYTSMVLSLVSTNLNKPSERRQSCTRTNHNHGCHRPIRQPKLRSPNVDRHTGQRWQRYSWLGRITFDGITGGVHHVCRFSRWRRHQLTQPRRGNAQVSPSSGCGILNDHSTDVDAMSVNLRN